MHGKPAKVFGPLRGMLAAVACGAGLSGCLSSFHPVKAPDPEATAHCREIPVGCRSNLYIFLFNGADPLHYANLVGLRDYLNEVGFTKTYYGQLYHAGRFSEELRQVHQERPDCRFVIIGFDHGAAAARQLAESAAAWQIPVELLVYLEPKGLAATACCPGAPVGRIINVSAGSDRLDGGAGLAGAENMYVPKAHWSSIPTHPFTVELLTRELTAIAMNIPTYSRPVDSSQLVEPAPTPRAVTAKKLDGPDEWDFLKLVGR